jgi:hypothetical protein
MTNGARLCQNPNRTPTGMSRFSLEVAVQQSLDL